MSALLDIVSERKRQIEAEGWTPEHDDHHGDGSLAMAAALYAAPAPLFCVDVEQPGEDEMGYGATYPGQVTWSDPWPWKRKQHVRHDLDIQVNDGDGRERHGRRRQLVIAGALLVAEIERLDRVAALRARAATEGEG